MAHLDSATALVACETALRQLMTKVYASSFGPDWLTKVAGTTKLDLWKDRAAEEAKSRGGRGVIDVANIGLAYANFYELVAWADRFWEPLSEALGAKRDVLPLLRRVDSLRNTVGHSRALVPFEEDLLAGIAGQIRNQVTIFMSSQSPAGDIYPRIESVMDSFGRRGGGGLGSVQLPLVVLHPGDIVTFTCVGTDPQGRDLLWRFAGSEGSRVVGQSGVTTLLNWSVEDRHVNESTTIGVYMEAHDAKYHRWGSFDHKILFGFRVRPPGV